MNEIKKLIDNKEKSEKKGLGVLGYKKDVKAFAIFWEQQGDNLAVVAADRLINFLIENDIDSKEARAYKKAQQDMNKFFIECWKERELERKEQERLMDDKSE